MKKRNLAGIISILVLLFMISITENASSQEADVSRCIVEDPEGDVLMFDEKCLEGTLDVEEDESVRELVAEVAERLVREEIRRIKDNA